jgi:hypothetical protein
MLPNNFSLTRGALRDVKRDVRLGRNLARNSDGLYRGRGDHDNELASPNMQWARVTSLTQTGTAYPGKLLTRFNSADGSFRDLENGIQVWVCFPHGFTPAATDVSGKTPFLCRQDQDRLGRPVFVAEDGGAALAVAIKPIAFSIALPGAFFDPCDVDGNTLIPDLNFDSQVGNGGQPFNVQLGPNLTGSTDVYYLNVNDVDAFIELPETALYMIGVSIIDAQATLSRAAPDPDDDADAAPDFQDMPVGVCVELWRESDDAPFASQGMDQTVAVAAYIKAGGDLSNIPDDGLWADLCCCGLLSALAGDQIFVNLRPSPVSDQSGPASYLAFTQGYLWGYLIK